jgi:Putative phage tail protein/Carbohydrate binding domain
MSGMFGGGRKTASSVEKLASIQINTSAYGHAKPLCYGTVRIAANMVDYDDFKSVAQKSSSGGGKGGGGSSSGTSSYIYYAGVILALCEGGSSGISNVLRVWNNRDVNTLAYYGLTLLTGARPQSPWATWTSKHPSRALGYGGTALLCNAALNLGNSGSVPNLNFETLALLATEQDPAYTSAYDAKPDAVVLDFLTNASYGAGWQSSRIADLVTGNASYATYCKAAGFVISPAFTEQRAAADHLQDVMRATNSEIVWSAGASGMQLKVVPYGDTAISANGATYTPNVTPLYNLTADDFLGVVDQDGKPTGSDPVSVTRSSVQDIKNIIPVEFSDRLDSYNTSVEDTPEAADVSQNGEKQDSAVSLHMITRRAHAFQISAILAQKQVYVRNTYTFTLGWKYILLEPMDLVTLTDPITGLNQKIVRIISVEMPDETGEESGLTITAEEWPFGTGTAALYATQVNQGNTGATSPAPSCITPVIFEPPALMTDTGGREIWLATDGAPNQWGGAYVWVSLDGGTSYGNSPIGVIKSGANMGVTSATLASSADPDTINTLSVDLSASVGSLSSTDVNGRDSFQMACLVENEIVSYQTATLTSPNNYNLTSMRRGGFGSPISSHASGVRFLLLDGSEFAVPYDSSLIGKTLYFKFQSFNPLGTGVQDLSSCAAYSYTIKGNLLPPSKNLVPDSDLKFGAAYWTLNVGGPLPIMAGLGADGGNALVYTGTGAASLGQYDQSTAITVTPGQTYTASVWVSNPAGSPTSGLSVYQVSPWTSLVGAIQPAGSSGRISATFTAPIGCTSVALLVGANTSGTYPNGSKLIFSNPQVEVGPAATDYKANLLDDASGHFAHGAMSTAVQGAVDTSGNVLNVGGVLGTRINTLAFESGVSAQDLITNGNFEDGLNGWSLSNAPVIDTSQTYAGSQSVKFPSGTTVSELAQGVPMTAGHLYQIQVWVKTNGSIMGAGSGAGFYIYDPGSLMTVKSSAGTAVNLSGQYPGVLLQAASATGWTLLQMVVLAGGGGSYTASLRVTNAYNTTGGNLASNTWFDAFSCVDLTAQNSMGATLDGGGRYAAGEAGANVTAAHALTATASPSGSGYSLTTSWSAITGFGFTVTCSGSSDVYNIYGCINLNSLNALPIQLKVHDTVGGGDYGITTTPSSGSFPYFISIAGLSAGTHTLQFYGIYTSTGGGSFVSIAPASLGCYAICQRIF